LRPITLIDDLILIIDMAKTMPFFYKLELTDIVNILKLIYLKYESQENVNSVLGS